MVDLSSICDRSINDRWYASFALRISLALDRVLAQNRDVTRILIRYMSILLASVRALFRSRREQAIVELALRQQLATYSVQRSRSRLTPVDRAFWVALSRIWPRWIRDGKRLGSKEGPMRAREARVPGFAGDGVALPAKEEAE
jgi:hypothetical protein